MTPRKPASRPANRPQRRAPNNNNSLNRSFANQPPPTARRRRRSRVRPQRSLSVRDRLIFSAITAVVILFGWAAIARQVAAATNTALTHFDAIIVLGFPADSDGNPSPDLQARVTEAVHEYQKGFATRLILSGGATQKDFVEARVMARSAEAQGIPESAIFLEPQADNTIENACYSVRIMRAHGWRSADVVAGAAQSQRAAIIFGDLARHSPPLNWRVDPAPPLEPESAAYQTARATVEVLKTARYLTWARWADRCEP